MHLLLSLQQCYSTACSAHLCCLMVQIFFLWSKLRSANDIQNPFPDQPYLHLFTWLKKTQTYVCNTHLFFYRKVMLTYIQGPEFFSRLPGCFGIHFQSVFLLSFITTITTKHTLESRSIKVSWLCPSSPCSRGRQELSLFIDEKLFLRTVFGGLSHLWGYRSLTNARFVSSNKPLQSSDAKLLLKHKCGHSVGLEIFPSQVRWEHTPNIW